MNNFSCKVLHTHKDLPARVMEVSTPHGKFITPVFMPVATRAGVNNMTPLELQNSGSQIILGGNTYHMLCAPGMARIEKAAGMHNFMGWSGPMLTDSGGFQIFSLSKNKKLCTIDEYGAYFNLPETGETIHMTPKMSLETQKIIGADIIMAFDECTRDNLSFEEVQKVMLKTHQWLLESKEHHQKNTLSKYGLFQALFGIIQGGVYQELREQSAQFIVDCETDGIAIGGETIGFNMEKTSEVLNWVVPNLPKEKPRYTMGVGMTPQDLLDVVKAGVDMFDCVAPTRNARHGALYCGQVVKEDNWLRFESSYQNSRLQIKKAIFSSDEDAIMQNCNCYTCKNYSRAYMHYLVKNDANLFTALACIHNVHVLHDVCDKMRDCIIKFSK